MTEIGFYQLTRTPLARALPQLLGRALAAGARCVVLCPDTERLAALDQALWLSQDPDWLPHGSRAEDAAYQPIFLATVEENPNGARFLFLVDGAAATDLGAWERVFDLFDGNDERAVAAARERWKAAKEAGHGLAYHQQTERGWEKRA